MSKTKEEIIKAVIKPLAPTYNLTIADCQQIVFPAMDEHTKNQAVLFRHFDPPIGSYTTEEIYDLFLQSQSQ